MTEKTAEKNLEEILLSLAVKKAEADIELLKAYENITKNAINGKPVTAKDFNIPEEEYNQKIKVINEQNKKMLPGEYDNNEKIVTLKSINIVEEWLGRNHEVLETINNVNPLDGAFHKQYITNAPSKNLSIPEDTETPQQLITAILEKNKGIAVGDIHTRSTAFQFIYNNIKLLKKSGVDTIYMEMDTEYFLDLDKLSTSDLRINLDARTPEIIEEDSKRKAAIYKVKEVDDIPGDYIRLFLAAKENGIRIVNIDKKEPARYFEVDMSPYHRIASTNYIWTENIIADRKDKPDDSKYIVFGGFSHFGSSYNWTKGMVDEGLGIPGIAFDNREKDHTTQIIRGDSQNGADFYLEGGKCYPDTKALANAADLNDQLLQKDRPATEAQQFKALIAQYKNEFVSGLMLECKAVKVDETKNPTVTSPPAQSMVQQQGK